MISKKSNILFVILILSMVLSGCHYSFTGASVPDHLHTIAIPLFKDNSGSGEPDLNSNFTSQIIQLFIDDNTLQLTEKQTADAILNCTISGFSDLPTTITGNEQISLRRVTLNVKAVYRDIVMKKTIWQQTFTNYEDYENKDDITQNRRDAIDAAIKKISEDILLAVVSNW